MSISQWLLVINNEEKQGVLIYVILLCFCKKTEKKEEDLNICLLNSMCLDILSWANSLLVKRIIRSNMNHIDSG